MKILIATDGSEHGIEATMQIAEMLPNIKTAVIKILTVVDYTVDAASEPFISSDEFLERVEGVMRQRSDEILSAAERLIREKNKDVVIERSTLVGSAKKMIVKEANEWNADLIVVGSHGYGVFARTLLGSVSDAVVHHAPCSVLVSRKKGSFQEEEAV